MIASYPREAIPEPYQILGLRLKPICLGHYIHMERFGVSFANGDPATPAGLSDLVMAVAICSMTYEEFPRFLENPHWRKRLKVWGGKCSIFDIQEKVSLFQRYLEEGSRKPIVVFENNSTESGAHWAQCVKLALVELGYTASQALNLPLGEAFADFYKRAENAGVLRIVPRAQAGMLQEALEAAQ